jgi:hypothetical protein
MSYSRDNPSPRYLELLRMYQRMHVDGERFQGVAAKFTFDGRSLKPQAQRIKRLIAATGASTVLDYGSGKGTQYDPKSFSVEGEGTWDSVLDYWAVDEVRCFDPAFLPFSTRPQGRFDGVICTDVLEHCPEEDVPWIVEELFSYAQRFVFATIACYPARKRLPNGDNAHCTIQPPEWWQEVFARTSAANGGLRWEAWVQWIEFPESKKTSEKRIGSVAGEHSSAR